MYLVTLDVGTGGLHLAIYDQTGKLLADTYETLHYSTDYRNRLLEFDPEHLFDRAMKLIGTTLGRVSPADHDDVIFSFTGQRHGCVFMNERGEPALAVANLDGRVDTETLQRFRPAFRTVYEVCGRLPSEIFPALRLSWMEEHQPDLYKQISSFLMINEWFAYRVCGVPHAERTSVTESLFFDVNSGEWSDRMFDLFGHRKLERWPIVNPGAIVGTITESVANRYSLPKGSLVSLGAGDTQCAAIGCRAFEKGDVVVVNGSTTPVVMVSDTLKFDPMRRTWTDLYDGTRYLIESNAGKTGMVYRDVMDIITRPGKLEPDIPSIFRVHDLDVTATLVPDPHMPVDFLGHPRNISFQSDPRLMLELLPYLILENTAFAIAANVDEVRRVGGTEIRHIYLTGGSSRSELTQQIVSILLKEYPLYITSTYDTTSKGAAMLASACRDERNVIEEVFLENDRDSWRKSVHTTVGSDIGEIIWERYDNWRNRFHDAKTDDGM